MRTFRWSIRDEFLDRADDLARMEDWWAGRDRNALALYGRRRVGKSWLLRAFADGKPAILLVSERRTEGAQLARFADRLAPHLGVRPDLPDLAALFEVLYSAAQSDKTLVVIDEFPYLLPAAQRKRADALSSIQAVMEERREASRLKVVLCGSHIAQMRTLLAEDSPLRGRLTPLPVVPLGFADAQHFLAGAGARERIERFAVAGGMSLYLDELARGPGGLSKRVCDRVLDRRGPLFNDPREVLEEEFRQPGVYFSLLEALAKGDRGVGDLATELKTKTTDLTPYLETLREMQLIERLAPVTHGRTSRDHRFRIADGFLRFWFRFVFPFQEDLRSGLRPADHYAGEVEPVLADHVAPTFESLCREWTRRTIGALASRVGSWWGPALHALRRSGERSEEEIDVVGVQRSRVSVVGECKWTTGRMKASVLASIEAYKLPALRQAGIKLTAEPQILLFSRAGFTASLEALAARRDDLRLVGLDELVDGLLASR
jgi:AAA+ ATPase superfamily predicted ATPase